MAKRVHIRQRMTQQQYDDLYNRRRTVRDLAKELGVNEAYLSSSVPERAPKKNYKLLKATRVLYKLQVAREVIQGRHTVAQGADLAAVSERTMYRLMVKVRKENDI